jgi:hypothetical protein
MNTRFPVLSLISVLLRLVGWLVVVGAVVYLIVNVVIEPSQAGHRWGPGNAMSLLTGGAATLLGLMIVALGEVVGVLFAIEENTRTHRVIATCLACVVLASALRAWADEIPKEEFDKKAASALSTAAMGQEAHYATTRTYVTCSNAADCNSKLHLTGNYKIAEDEVELQMLAQGQRFTGTAKHKMGTGRVFQFDSGALGPQPR